MNEYDSDILDTTIKAGIPGALFGTVADTIHKAYPISRRKAQLTALEVLKDMMQFYEAVAAEEGEG